MVRRIFTGVIFATSNNCDIWNVGTNFVHACLSIIFLLPSPPLKLFVRTIVLLFPLSSLLVMRLIFSFSWRRNHPAWFAVPARMSRIFNLFSIPFSHWRLNKKFRLYRRRLSRGSCTLCWADCCWWTSFYSSPGRWSIHCAEESRALRWSCLLTETRTQWSSPNWNIARASTIVYGSVSMFQEGTHVWEINCASTCNFILIQNSCIQNWKYFSRFDLRL